MRGRAEHKDFLLFGGALLGCAILFGLATLKKYSGSLVSFISWLTLIFMVADMADMFRIYGAEYYQVEVLLAYVIVFCTLVAIGLSRQKVWLKQAGLLAVGAVVIAASLKWVGMSRVLNNELNRLDTQISHIHERLEGSACYFPLKDTTLAMAQEKITETDEILAVAGMYLPDEPPIKAFDRAIHDEADSIGLQVDKFEFIGQRNREFYSESIFKGMVTGGEEQYHAFKEAVQNMPWLITWEEVANDSSFGFTGRLYDYVSEAELADKKAVEFDNTERDRCSINRHDDVWWPHYANRLEEKQKEFKGICMEQKPFEKILKLEDRFRENIKEVLARLSVFQELAKTTNNKFARGYKPDIPLPCYKQLRGERGVKIVPPAVSALSLSVKFYLQAVDSENGGAKHQIARNTKTAAT